MKYENDKFILDDGHVVPAKEAMEIHKQIELNTYREDVEQSIYTLGCEGYLEYTDDIAKEVIKQICTETIDQNIAYEVTKKMTEELASARERISRSFEIKRKIVDSGDSYIFKNWQKLVPSLAKSDFLIALYWLCEDPLTVHGKLTREIGLTNNGLVKLRRVHNEYENFIGFYSCENGELWGGDSFLIPCSNKNYADENGMTKTHMKVSISARDRI